MTDCDRCENCGNTGEGETLYQCVQCEKITCEKCDKSRIPGFSHCPSCDKYISDFMGFIDSEVRLSKQQ